MELAEAYVAVRAIAADGQIAARFQAVASQVFANACTIGCLLCLVTAQLPCDGTLQTVSLRIATFCRHVLVVVGDTSSLGRCGKILVDGGLGVSVLLLD